MARSGIGCPGETSPGLRAWRQLTEHAMSRERLVGSPRASECIHLHHQRFGLRPSLPISHQLLLPFSGGREHNSVLLASASPSVCVALTCSRTAPQPPLWRAAGPARSGGIESSGQKVASAASWAPRSSSDPHLPKGSSAKSSTMSSPGLPPPYVGEAAAPGWVAGTGTHSLGPRPCAKRSGCGGPGTADRSKRGVCRRRPSPSEARDANDLIKIQITSAAGRREHSFS